jgi:hypothetical protein
MRENMPMDYVKFARAKGLSMRRVVFVHVLKNIMIPIITVLGLELGSTIAFSVVTETIFAWPGMGKLIIDSINALDRPVVVAYLMVIVFMFILINLVSISCTRPRPACGWPRSVVIQRHRRAGAGANALAALPPQVAESDRPRRATRCRNMRLRCSRRGSPQTRTTLPSWICSMHSRRAPRPDGMTTGRH